MTPAAIARRLPSPVRSRISSRSNSAMISLRGTYAGVQVRSYPWSLRRSPTGRLQGRRAIRIMDERARKRTRAVPLGWTQESSAIHRNADRLGMNRYLPPRRMLKVSMLVTDAFLRRALGFARRKPCRVRRTHQGGSLLAGESISGRIAHRGRERLRLSYRRWIIGACQQRLEPRRRWPLGFLPLSNDRTLG